MNISGWIFMLLSWGLSLVTAFCLLEFFFRKRKMRIYKNKIEFFNVYMTLLEWL